MSTLDIFLLIPLIWFAYKGFSNGLVSELASILALVFGVYLSLKFSDFIGKKMGLEGNVSSIFAFIITFIAVVIIINFAGKFVSKIFEWTSLSIINKLAGLLFGLIKISFIISVMIYIVERLDNNRVLLTKETRENSVLFPYLQKIAPKIITGLKIDDKYHERDDFN